MVALPKTSRENAIKTAERIKQAIEAETSFLDFAKDKLTISIGITTTRLPLPADCLLKHADRALHKAKEAKNAIVAYEQSGDVRS